MVIAIEEELWIVGAEIPTAYPGIVEGSENAGGMELIEGTGIFGLSCRRSEIFGGYRLRSSEVYF